MPEKPAKPGNGATVAKTRVEPPGSFEAPLNARARAAHWDGFVSYGLACRCGHSAVKKMLRHEAEAARFKCSKCGRTQTRENTAC